MEILCQQPNAVWIERIRRDGLIDAALIVRQSGPDLALLSALSTQDRHRFQVDADLKSLRHELRHVGQPLTSTFTILSQ